MSKKMIIFDFDGTIANTLDAIVDLYNRIAPNYGCRTVQHEDRTKLRSKRLQEFLKDYGVTNFKLPFLLLRVRKELRSKIADIKPITGVVEMLNDIKNAGFRLGVMTSNSKENVEIFLQANELNDVFDFVYSGRNIFGKDRVIGRLLRDHKIKKETAVYIGDETRDIEAANKVGISVVAVSWGFNTSEILAASQPDKVMDHPNNLLECLRKI